jgi:hypothetical protein
VEVQVMVLTEEEGLELLAYLVTAARTQLDEAAEYGPMRLLTAAQRLGTFMVPRSSQATRELIEGSIQPMPATTTRSADPDGYVAALDGVCGAMAEHLVEVFDVDPGDR